MGPRNRGQKQAGGCCANEGGSAVFFVSNNRTGSITIRDSITRGNPRGTFETPNLFGFYVIAKEPAMIINSQILR